MAGGTNETAAAAVRHGINAGAVRGELDSVAPGAAMDQCRTGELDSVAPGAAMEQGWEAERGQRGSSGTG